MFKRLWKKIRKWYQSQINCLNTQETYHQVWQHILEQAELANETWYVEPSLVEPARDSVSVQSDG